MTNSFELSIVRRPMSMAPDALAISGHRKGKSAFKYEGKLSSIKPAGIGEFAQMCWGVLWSSADGWACRNSSRNSKDHRKASESLVGAGELKITITRIGSDTITLSGWMEKNGCRYAHDALSLKAEQAKLIKPTLEKIEAEMSQNHAAFVKKVKEQEKHAVKV